MTPFQTAKEGAETIIYLALSSQMEGVGGKYLEDCAILKSSPYSRVHDYQQQLWQKSWTLIEDRIEGLPNPMQ